MPHYKSYQQDTSTPKPTHCPYCGGVADVGHDDKDCILHLSDRIRSLETLLDSTIAYFETERS